MYTPQSLAQPGATTTPIQGRNDFKVKQTDSSRHGRICVSIIAIQILTTVLDDLMNSTTNEITNMFFNLLKHESFLRKRRGLSIFEQQPPFVLSRYLVINQHLNETGIVVRMIRFSFLIYSISWANNQSIWTMRRKEPLFSTVCSVLIGN